MGNSRVRCFLVFSACLNVALDLALIVGGGMGVEGAALATVLSQAVSAVLCGGYIFLKTPDLMPEPVSGVPTKETSDGSCPLEFPWLSSLPLQPPGAWSCSRL
ncbi:MAG: hypothetical protein ACLU8D_06905 [Enterocloster sp.]